MGDGHTSAESETRYCECVDRQTPVGRTYGNRGLIEYCTVCHFPYSWGETDA